MKNGTIGVRDVVIVMATYNEAVTITELLNALPYRVIVVDDSSPDGTGDLAKACGAVVISRPRKSGIASAYYDGFRVALDDKPR
jgi:dolichol-phosphate mannosyltransferase